jgi:hypothetical protein
MTAGPLVVYEVPDSAGHGHKLLVPTGGAVTAAMAAELVASIRGPAHVAADRLGVIRAMKQGSRGANRDASAIAVVAGIEVHAAPPGSVVAALSALEGSLDAAIAEAAGAASPAHATSLPSNVAVKTADSIAALGFRNQSLEHIDPRHGVSRERQVRSERAIDARSRRGGVLAALACGVAIGWAIRPFVPSIPSGRLALAPVGPDAAAITEPARRVEPTAGVEAREEDIPPARNTNANRLQASEPSLPPSVAPEPALAETPCEPAPSVEAGPAFFTESPSTETNPDTGLMFHVECHGTEAGDQVQLLRSANQRPIGVVQEAQSDRLSFDVYPAADLTSPRQLMISFSKPPPPLSWKGIKQIKRLSQRANTDEFSCEFSGMMERRIVVTVTIHAPRDRQAPVPPMMQQ